LNLREREKERDETKWEVWRIWNLKIWEEEEESFLLLSSNACCRDFHNMGIGFSERCVRERYVCHIWWREGACFCLFTVSVSFIFS
jgi:hypothetical protein